ncbi:hypothetical protein BH18ACT5_BH18ACT5_01990 [soil metagenome]
MEMIQALTVLAAADLEFEVVYEGDKEDCPLCLSRETRQAA